MKYALYDAYEADAYPGELICESDDWGEIKIAAIKRMDETDGESLLHVVKSEEKEEEVV